MTRTPTRNRGLGLVRPAWFAGARKDILDRCPTEVAFFNGLGMAVLATAIISGCTLSIALGFTLHEAATDTWPIGAAWTLVVLNLDRLLLMLTATRRLALALVPRIIISFVIGAMIAEVVTLWIYAPEINAQMQRDVQHGIQASTKDATNFYSPQITRDQRAVATIQSSENSLVAQINEDMFLANCESTDANCSTTHQLGCGAYCLHYRQVAASLQKELDAVRPGDENRIRQLQTAIAGLNSSEANSMQILNSSARASTGLIAREDALTEIERAHPGILVQVWFIRSALILLDMMPLIIKSLYLAFSESSYEAIASSYKRRERVTAVDIDLQARVERGRLNEQALADEALNRVRIQSQRDSQIAAEEAKWFGESSSQSQYSSESDLSTRSNGITTPDFTDFVVSMRSKRPHESLPAGFPRGLTIAGWIGVGLLAALASTLWLLTDATHRSVTGEMVALLALMSVVSLAVFTRGFRSAPAWAMRATFAALLVGLSLPVIVAVLNL
ncbi:MAG: DUF4407 domain-containing protein [Acidimicrobiales bacterium]